MRSIRFTAFPVGSSLLVKLVQFHSRLAWRYTFRMNAYRACVLAAPSSAEAHYNLGNSLTQLGDYAGALAQYTRSLELEDDPTRRPDLLGMRYFQGLASREDVERAIATESLPLSLLVYLYSLLDHPDPQQRDPKFVLRLIEEQPTLSTGVDWLYLLTTVAKIRNEDWAEALAAFEGHYTPPTAIFVTPMAFDFIRSLIYSKLGRDDVAREFYARAMGVWNDQTRGNEPAWSHSDVMRWRKEAEAALTAPK